MPPMLNLVCQKCHAPFIRRAKDVKDPSRAECSRYCVGTVPCPLGPSTPIVFLTCEHCDRLFVRRTKEVSHDAAHTYCSDACHILGRSAVRPDAATLATLRETHSNEAIGAMYGVAARRIRKWVRAYALQDKRMTEPPTNQATLTTMTLTMNDKAIGREFGVSSDTIRWWRHKWGISSWYQNTQPLREAKRTKARLAMKIQCQQRQARLKRSPTNDFTPEQWEEVKAAYRYRCVYCGQKMKSKDLTQDHITPLSKGGAHTKSNIVPACRSCNSRKHNGPVLSPVQPLLL